MPHSPSTPQAGLSIEEDAVYLSSLYRAERGTADALKALVSQSLDRRAFDAGKVTCWAEERLGLKFSEDQRQAVQMAVTQADIAREAGEFQLTDVLDSVNRKLVRRHPHVFGDVSVADAREVERNWERIKEAERQQKGQRKSPVDGIPKDLPALTYAQLMQDRVARVGFEWEDISGVLDKIVEEVEEFRRASTDGEKVHELGDLFLAMVNLSRWLNIQAEDALRQANRRFQQRYTTMEELARQRGQDFAQLPLDEKEALWQEAKGLVG
jgi:tetrapyrrole methylase family protein/MazG family protein